MIKRSFVQRMNYVWKGDPALDVKSEGFEDAWKQFLEDGIVEKLPVKEGERPSVFEVKPLSRSVYLRVFAITDTIEQLHEAFAYGVKGVRDVIFDDKPLVLDFDRKGKDDERLNKASLDALFHPMLVADVGNRVMELAVLGPPRG